MSGLAKRESVHCEQLTIVTAKKNLRPFSGGSLAPLITIRGASAPFLPPPLLPSYPSLSTAPGQREFQKAYKYINGFIDTNSDNITKDYGHLSNTVRKISVVHLQYMLMILYLQIIMKNQMPLTTNVLQFILKKTCHQYPQLMEFPLKELPVY